VIPAPGQDFQLLDVTLDDPLDDEVVVDMVACGSVHRLPYFLYLFCYIEVDIRMVG
jgi:Zn-dependent alcohol dehydrogenase